MGSKQRDPRSVARFTRSTRSASALLAAMLGVVLGSAVLAACGESDPPPTTSSTTTAPSTDTGEGPRAAADAALQRGLTLYAGQCAACHGDQGLGDGPAAYLLRPMPRDFSTGQFRLGSTASGLPTAADLRATLERGMPGSAMPPWRHLPSADLDALVAAVRHLAVAGRELRLVADDAELSAAEAREIAEDLLATGPVIELPPDTTQGPDSAGVGRRIFMESCASCHDEDGRGRIRTDLVDTRGNPIFPRDFTQGIFKGSTDPAAIAMRIRRGQPGSPMPATDLPAEELWPVVRYILGMVPEGAQERASLDQRALRAERVEGTLTTDLDAPPWTRTAPIFMPVAPLVWRADRIEGVEFQALHDGSRLAIRMRWADTTRDDHQLTQTSFADGAAIQFSNDADPPLFAMGAKGAGCNIWHWKATWSRDSSEGAPALAAVTPNMPSDPRYSNPGHPGEDVFDTARAAGNPTAQEVHPSPVADLVAAGFGTLTQQGASEQNVSGAARYVNGHWEVVFLRDLPAPGGGDVALQPSRTVSVALAVWDGAAGDRNGTKAITIWHPLTLAD